MKLGITAMIAGKAVHAAVDLPPIVWTPQNNAGAFRDPTPAPDTFPQALLRVDLGIYDDTGMATHKVTIR